MKKFVPLLILPLFLLFSSNSFGQWHIEQLTSARLGLTATSTDSLVFFASGVDQFAFYNDVDIYNINSETWSQATLSVERTWFSSAAGNGKVLFAGGWDFFAPNGNQTSEAVDIHDLNSGGWTTANLSEGRGFLTAVRVGNKILVAGGLKLIDFNTASYEVSDVVDIYDLNTGYWTTANLSQARGFIGGTANGNLAFFAGGWAGPGQVSNVVDIYNADNDQWTTDTLSEARGQIAAASVGNKVLFAGGGHAGNFSPSDRVDIYDLDQDEWTIATISLPRGEMEAATVGDKVYFACGSTIDQITLNNGLEYFRRIDIYDDEDGSWSTDSVQHDRVNHAVTSLENKLFVAGGNDLTTIFDQVEIFCDTTLSTSTLNLQTKGEIEIFPNPSSEYIQIDFEKTGLPNHIESRLIIQHFTGRTIKEKRLNTLTENIAVSDLTTGIYFITLFTEKGNYSKKLVIE